MTARYLVLSDMHFGTPQSSINSARYRDALVEHIAAKAPWDEVIFAGDLLDANLSTLTRAIEGRRRNGSPELFGFRSFVEAIDAAARGSGRAAALADAVRSWVYVPGNHDYKVWDLLATRVACEDVLARGDPLGSVPMPLARWRWTGDESFFAGIFQPLGAASRVVVEYPNHEVSLGDAGGKMVFTHGHYLDPSQTRGNDLSANLAQLSSPARIAAAVRKIVIETAQYQAIASAVSYSDDTRRLVDDLVGPDGLLDKARKLLAEAAGWLLRLVFGGEGSQRGEAISPRQLANIEAYLTRFCAYAPVPGWFVFGHTHRQDAARTPNFGIRAFNAGSCYPDRGLPITFLEIEVEAGEAPEVRLMCVDGDGAVRPSPFADDGATA